MKRIYLYPKIDHERTDSSNTYVNDLDKALNEEFIVVNDKYNKIGVIDFFRYIFKSDIYFFNWIEELPSNRYGKLQCIVFITFLIIVKLLGKKVFWVLHNKGSHNKSGSLQWKQVIFNLMIKYSDLIITHSNNGLEFIKEKYPKHIFKVRYIIHPVKDIIITDSVSEKKYDLLIWGTIYPYKGIYEFLKFIEKKNRDKKYNILIIGYCPNKKYESKIKQYVHSGIIYIDKYLTIEEIYKFAQQSRFILFTYNSKSVLSSGSLMDSIRFRIPIIGPDIGAFKDLKKYKFIKTYKEYNDIIKILDDKLDLHINKDEIKKFCNENTWELFALKIKNIIITENL